MNVINTCFPPTIKKYILEKIIIVKDNFEKKGNLDKDFFNRDIYCFDEDEKNDKEFIKHLVKFINSKKELQKIFNENIKISYPSVFNRGGNLKAFRVSLGTSVDDVLDIFNDFIIYSVGRLLNSSDIYNKLEKYWGSFEREMFANKIEVKLVANISQFYSHYGGDLRKLIPDPNIEIKYLSPIYPEERIIRNVLLKDIKGCYIKDLSKEFNKYGIVIVYKQEMKKTEDLNRLITNSEDIFNKICLVLRLICGGSVHYDFVRPFYLGNHSSPTSTIKEFPENHLFSYNGRDTIIRGDWEENLVKKLWVFIKNRDYFEWVFSNQKIRDSYYRKSILKSSMHYCEKFKFFIEVERLIDLIQALENLMGGSGVINKIPAAKLIAKGNSEKEMCIEMLVANLYGLRDKYIHGSINSLTSLFKKNFGNLDVLVREINLFENYIKKIMIFDIANKDFKDKISKYKKSLKPPTKIIVTGKTKPIPFPQLNTIYMSKK